MYRHGDVIIEPADDAVKAGAKVGRDAQGDVVLAQGEATGHAHRIRARGAELFELVGGGSNDNGARLLVVTRPVCLRHEEHSRIKLPPGRYKVRVKRQYSPDGGWANVTD